MALWSSLRQMYDEPIPNRPTLMESLSLSQTRHVEQITTSFKMFGEIQFREKPPSSTNSPLPTPLPAATSSFTLHQSPQNYAEQRDEKEEGGGGDGKTPKNQCSGDANSNGGFPLKNSETLQFCTDSTDDVGDVTNDESGKHLEKANINDNNRKGFMRSYSNARSRSIEKFPPPITTIGRGRERPWICFKSYRKDGRFVLKESRIPTQQCLQATRGNGRLVLQLVHPEGGIEEHDDDYDGEVELLDKGEETDAGKTA